MTRRRRNSPGLGSGPIPITMATRLDEPSIWLAAGLGRSRRARTSRPSYARPQPTRTDEERASRGKATAPCTRTAVVALCVPKETGHVPNPSLLLQLLYRLLYLRFSVAHKCFGYVSGVITYSTSQERIILINAIIIGTFMCSATAQLFGIITSRYAIPGLSPPSPLPARGGVQSSPAACAPPPTHPSLALRRTEEEG